MNPTNPLQMASNMRTDAARPCLPALALLLTLAACKSPKIEFEARKAAADAKAVKLLQDQYGLPGPPPLKLEVSKAGEAAPGVFRLVVEEPGWSLDLPLERRRVEPVQGPSRTIFTWELPARRVKNELDSEGGPMPLLLDLSKGQDHRALVVPWGVTKWLAREWAVTAVGIGFLALVWPITLTVAGLSQATIDSDIRRTYGEEHVMTMLETRPGPAAPTRFPGAGALIHCSASIFECGIHWHFVNSTSNAWPGCPGSTSR